jgi:lysophospholipase L1-like esterase
MSSSKPIQPKKKALLFLVGLYSTFFLFSLNGLSQWNTNEPIRMLALGDSYTIGQSIQANLRWPEQLLDSLANQGYNRDTLQIIATTGWRTDQLLNAIQGQGLKKKNFNLVSLLIGVNNQYQGLPIALYKPQLLSLIDSALSYVNNDSSRFILVSIPDYAYTPFGQQSANPFIISQQLDAYNSIAKQMADSLNLAFFNITPISRRGISEPQLIAGDGLHPSGTQYSLWVSHIINKVDSVKLLSVSTPKFERPRFSVINGEVCIDYHANNPLRTLRIFTSSGENILNEDRINQKGPFCFKPTKNTKSFLILHCSFEKNQLIKKIYWH